MNINEFNFFKKAGVSTMKKIKFKRKKNKVYSEYSKESSKIQSLNSKDKNKSSFFSKIRLIYFLIIKI